MSKRHIPALLLTAVIAAESASCGALTDQTETTSDTDSVSTAVIESVPSDRDELPELRFSGRKFRVLSTETTNYIGYLDVAETTGDLLNDAIYDSNRAVEERFDVVIAQQIIPLSDANNTVVKLLAAGEHEYDIMSMTDRYALEQAVQGALISYAELPNVDLDKDYWARSINDSIRIGGEQWLAYGDFNLSVYDYTYALAFNKKLVDELKLENPYTLVDSGKWTFDAFNRMCVATSADLNGDSKMDENDRYGWSANAKQITPTMWIAAGARSIKKDKDDLPYFSMANDEIFLEVYGRIVDLAWSNDAWYTGGIKDQNINLDPMFSDGNALFQTTSFGLLGTGYYRDMKIDYGVLPHPKWDEAQEGYYSRVEGGRIFIVPVTTTDTEFTGLMLEALASSAHANIIPAYFEVALKTKYTRDDESSRMFDLIMDTRVYDLGDTFWCSQIRDNFMRSLFREGSKDLSSAVAANKDSIDTLLKETADALRK